MFPNVPHINQKNQVNKENVQKGKVNAPNFPNKRILKPFQSRFPFGNLNSNTKTIPTVVNINVTRSSHGQNIIVKPRNLSRFPLAPTQARRLYGIQKENPRKIKVQKRRFIPLNSLTNHSIRNENRMKFSIVPKGSFIQKKEEQSSNKNDLPKNKETKITKDKELPKNDSRIEKENSEVVEEKVNNPSSEAKKKYKKPKYGFVYLNESLLKPKYKKASSHVIGMLGSLGLKESTLKPYEFTIEDDRLLRLLMIKNQSVKILPNNSKISTMRKNLFVNRFTIVIDWEGVHTDFNTDRIDEIALLDLKNRWKNCLLEGKNIKFVGYWKKIEDDFLLSYIKKVYKNNEIKGPGSHWKQIAQYVYGRSAKQVRRRFVEYINPSLKMEPLTEKEKQYLRKQQLVIGNKFSQLGRELNRSENMIKNFFYNEKKNGLTPVSIPKPVINDSKIKIPKKKANKNPTLKKENKLKRTIDQIKKKKLKKNKVIKRRRRRRRKRHEQFKDEFSFLASDIPICERTRSKAKKIIKGKEVIEISDDETEKKEEQKPLPLDYTDEDGGDIPIDESFDSNLFDTEIEFRNGNGKRRVPFTSIKEKNRNPQKKYSSVISISNLLNNAEKVLGTTDPDSIENEKNFTKPTSRLSIIDNATPIFNKRHQNLDYIQTPILGFKDVVPENYLDAYTPLSTSKKKIKTIEFTPQSTEKDDFQFVYQQFFTPINITSNKETNESNEDRFFTSPEMPPSNSEKRGIAKEQFQEAKAIVNYMGSEKIINRDMYTLRSSVPLKTRFTRLAKERRNSKVQTKNDSPKNKKKRKREVSLPTKKVYRRKLYR